MPRFASRLLTPFAVLLLAGPAGLWGQLKIEKLSAASDVTPFYHETTWDNLRGLKQIAGPLVNLSFVTESGFQPAQRDEIDRALPGNLRLVGLQHADFQEIADVAYDALVADLNAAGVRLAPYEAVAVNRGFLQLADRAQKTGRERPVPPAYEAIVRRSGGRRTMTFTGRRRPFIESFLAAGYLPATRLTRELNAALPIVSFLIDFVEYSNDRAATYDWSELLTAEPARDVPRLRARPQVYVAGGSAAVLMPGGQTARLTLNTPTGFERRFVTDLELVKHDKRKGDRYEVTVDPAAYKQAVIAALKPHMTAIARKIAPASR